MASKKKKKNSNSYWMKYGGTPRKMNLGGDWAEGISGFFNEELAIGREEELFPFKGDWSGGRSSQFTMGPGNRMLHELTGRMVGPGYPQYEPGHQRGRSNPEREWDYVYENGGDPTTDPTFKAWFAKNATRKDVMESSGNTDALRELFLSDVGMNELPLFSDEIDDFGNVDKSGRDLGTSFQMLDQYRYGGRPKAQFGHKGYTSSPTDYTRDYSGIADRNPNMMQDIGAVGDTNMLQYLGPIGYAADIVADVIGFKGDVQQNFDNTKDAFAAQSTLGVLNRKNVNKGTLDLSTRTDALNALAGHQGYKPDLWKDLMPELGQSLGVYLKGEGSDLLAGIDTGGDIGDAAEVDLGEGNEWARYGLPNRMTLPKAETGLSTIRKRPGMSNAGKYKNVKDFAGPHGTYPINSIDRGRSALKLAYHSSNPDAIKSKVYAKYPSLAVYGGTFGEDKIQKGRQEFESGMDLRNLRAFGGANMIGPQVGGSFGVTPQLDQQKSYV